MAKDRGICILLLLLFIILAWYLISTSPIPNGHQLLILLGAGAHMGRYKLLKSLDMVCVLKGLNQVQTVQAVSEQEEISHGIQMNTHLRLFDLGCLDIDMSFELSQTNSLLSSCDPWVAQSEVDSMN